VQDWAARHENGTVDVLVWNGTANVSLLAGDPRLDRRVVINVSGLGSGGYRASLARVDARHSNIVARCPPDVIWPDETLWASLRAADKLYEEPLGDVSPGAGTASFDLDLPMPGVVRIRLTPRP
jgi:xylan 1,4-beta-xylosidase